MKSSTLLLLFLVVSSSACIDYQKPDEKSSYLNTVQTGMNEVSANLEEYLDARSSFNIGVIDRLEAYEYAKMEQARNRDISGRLNSTITPEGFERFHGLVISFTDHIFLVYEHDMDCIKEQSNESCMKAKEEVAQARNISDEAMAELTRLGVDVS